MIKGKTKSGIKFVLDERIKDDTRFMYYIARIQAPDLSAEEASEVLIGMLRLIFGSNEKVIGFMNEVAAKHKGVCDQESLMAELSDMFEALQVKNSSSSPRS